ncbi:hypothetical protein V8F33_002934 [Rhypophila sp. PSN 637]
MVALSTRALMLFTLALGAVANPLLNLAARQENAAKDPCAVVRCAGGTVCQAINGKAQCVKGISCGPTTCAAGDVCCNSSCGICTKPGGACIQLFCEPPRKQCGPNLCAADEDCCNESCGICTPKGGFCTLQFCTKAGPKCGSKNCPSGTVCCNSSCGICTPPDGACTQQICPSSD